MGTRSVSVAQSRARGSTAVRAGASRVSTRRRCPEAITLYYTSLWQGAPAYLSLRQTRMLLQSPRFRRRPSIGQTAAYILARIRAGETRASCCRQRRRLLRISIVRRNACNHQRATPCTESRASQRRQHRQPSRRPCPPRRPICANRPRGTLRWRTPSVVCAP